MLCFASIHELNLKVCLGRLNTNSFAQENSKLEEPITLEGHAWGTAVPNVHASARIISAYAGCSWAYPTGYLGRQNFWMFLAMLSAAQAQTCTYGKRQSPEWKLEFHRKQLCGESLCCSINCLLGSAGFDTEKCSSPQKSKSH